MRLMLDFSGFNRGYAFITYTSRESARRCVKELNQFEIRPNRSIGVCQSVDNCRLFVGGIPKLKKREEILDEIGQVTEGVVDVIVYPSAHDKTKNRGFAFVEYESHRAAAMARRKLLPGKIQLWGQQIAVDWAEPEAEVDEDVMATVRVLYVRNLMITTSEEQIKEIFERYKSNAVERVKKLKDYAFVHFREREDALHAMNLINGQSRRVSEGRTSISFRKRNRRIDRRSDFGQTGGQKSIHSLHSRRDTRQSADPRPSAPSRSVLQYSASQCSTNGRKSLTDRDKRQETRESSIFQEKCLEDLYKETYDALLATGAVVAAPPPPPAPFLLIDCFNQQTHFLRAEDQSSLSQQQREEVKTFPSTPSSLSSLVFLRCLQ